VALDADLLERLEESEEPLWLAIHEGALEARAKWNL
jgi:hypothetical protein